MSKTKSYFNPNLKRVKKKKKKNPFLVGGFDDLRCVCLRFWLFKVSVDVKTNGQGSPSTVFYIDLNSVLRFPKLV